MARLIRIGTTVVNLDRVQFIRRGRWSDDDYESLDLVFSSLESGEDYVQFVGEELAAFNAYLEGEVVDVMSWHAERERRKAEDEALKASSDANMKLLDCCTNEAGHAWKMNPVAGYDCVHCSAHDGSRSLDYAINCWGGAEHTAGQP